MKKWTVMAALLVLFSGAQVWAEKSSYTQEMISAHQEAAVEAQKKVAFHEEMERRYVQGKGGGKFDMVGHCRFWADYYRKVAEKEKQAAEELEKNG